MLITLKTLQEDLFTVEVDPLQTVRHFKENIERVRGDAFPAKYTKLMYAGKFLLDSKRVCDYDLEEKKFVILVVKKPKRPVIKEEEPDPAETPCMNASSSNSAERDRILCADHEQLVQHIVELGFTRHDVEQALCASFNNPDRAVEYLINGAPGPSRSSQPTASRSRPTEDPNDISDAALLHHMNRPDPPNQRDSILPSQERIFELFSEALAEYQNSNREQERMLESDRDIISESFAEMEAAGMSDPSGTMGSASGTPEDLPNGMFSGTDGMFDFLNDGFCTSIGALGALGMSSPLMDMDHEAIERLKQLGFSDSKVIEAYFVCDRDENAAADYLFSQKFE